MLNFYDHFTTEVYSRDCGNAIRVEDSAIPFNIPTLFPLLVDSSLSISSSLSVSGSPRPIGFLCSCTTSVGCIAETDGPILGLMTPPVAPRPKIKGLSECFWRKQLSTMIVVGYNPLKWVSGEYVLSSLQVTYCDLGTCIRHVNNGRNPVDRERYEENRLSGFKYLSKSTSKSNDSNA